MYCHYLLGMTNKYYKVNWGTPRYTQTHVHPTIFAFSFVNIYLLINTHAWNVTREDDKVLRHLEVFALVVLSKWTTLGINILNHFGYHSWRRPAVTAIIVQPTKQACWTWLNYQLVCYFCIVGIALPSCLPFEILTVEAIADANPKLVIYISFGLDLTPKTIEVAKWPVKPQPVNSMQTRPNEDDWTVPLKSNRDKISIFSYFIKARTRCVKYAIWINIMVLTVKVSQWCK